MSSNARRDFRTNLWTMIAALVVGLGLMVAKFFAYWLTGSSAILSDALEAIINVVAGAFALGSVILSAKPPDESHPYGHGKIEHFSAGFEGALIIIAALGIFVEGVRQILAPVDLPDLQSGMYIMIGSGLINLIMGFVLIRTGKKTGSLVLLADGRHIMTDVLTSIGVLGGLVLVYISGWYLLDGAVACILGVNITVSGFHLVRQAFLGLMDASDPELLNEICKILENHRKDIWIDVHRLRAWRSGNRIHVDFHLILPRDLSLHVAHHEVKDLEQIFRDCFRGLADVLIHLDPCEDSECPVCAYDPCDIRKNLHADKPIWRRDVLTCETEQRSG